MRHERSLDALNFFLADVRHGLGPYLAIYLLTERHWAEDQIGFVMTIAVANLIVAELNVEGLALPKSAESGNFSFNKAIIRWVSVKLNSQRKRTETDCLELMSAKEI